VRQVVTIALSAVNKVADIAGLLPQDAAPNDVLDVIINNLDTGKGGCAWFKGL
jgi:signal transduction histidine kinase